MIRVHGAVPTLAGLSKSVCDVDVYIDGVCSALCDLCAVVVGKALAVGALLSALAVISPRHKAILMHL